MAAVTLTADASTQPAPPLPARMKLLCVTTLHQASGWIAQALAAEQVGQARLEEAVGAASAMARLRDEAFDAVIVLHESGVFQADTFVLALRAGGHDEPVIVLGDDASPDAATNATAAGADAYCPIRHTSPRLLLWKLSGAIRRCELERENRRLQQAERQRLAIEHQEAERLLAEQRGLLVQLDDLRRQSAEGRPDGPPLAAAACSPAQHPMQLPQALVVHYRDVLRAYVIMGVGNLKAEMAKLAELLAASGVTAQQAMELHLDVLEQLVGGLGARSARHVMNRADLLILELMIHLADGYRRRYQDYERPPQQQLLPGFGCDAQAA